MSRFAHILRQTVALPAAGLLIVSGLALSLPGSGSAQQAVQDLLSIPRRGDELKQINPNTGETISALTIKLPEGTDCDLVGGRT